MDRPQYLQDGDKIRIVSPAGKLKKERVQPAVEWLERKGYVVKLGKHVFAEQYQFAGSDKQRLEDLQSALDDPDCKAIICARGGYGTVRIIEKLDFSGFKKYPKWLVGYSDITVLHLAINNLGFETIHGSMPPFFFTKAGAETQNLHSLMDLLRGRTTNYRFNSNEKKRTGSASGELTGGNLSIITSLLGTAYEIQTEGKILFIEDIDEYLYHIDRMMYQLKLAGKLSGLSGMLVGDFTGIKDNDDPFGQTVEEIIWEAVKPYDFPVSFGFKAGHDDLNLALNFGRAYDFEVGEDESTISCGP